MTRLRLALLNAAHEPASTTRNFRRELDADLAEFHVTGGQFPSHFDWDGVVITGSRSSVYWDDEWIPRLVEWTAEAAEAGIPILGVCYGHQVLAEALGGNVAAMDEFEIGYTEIRRVRGNGTDGAGEADHEGGEGSESDADDAAAGDDLLAGIDDEFTVFATHGDAVVELPPGAELLAENEYGIHAFRAGHCWGVQFHPEYDANTAREVAEGKRDRLGDERVDAVLAEITPENYDAACEAKRLFENFTAYARRLKTEREASAEVGA